MDEINTTGDGFCACFDGPARAICCARTILDAASELGLELRAGLHAGECEVRGNNLGGITVHVAARVGALARPAELLVTNTVRDLVAGSGIRFTNPGLRPLKGVLRLPASTASWHCQRMLHVGIVALGVTDVDRAARFWCEALGYDHREDGFGGWPIVLVPRSGSGTKLALQRSETHPEEYPRIHLDLHVESASEQMREIQRLVSLGAVRVEWTRYPDDPDFVVLADPEGNRFCIVDLSHNAPLLPIGTRG